MGLLKCLLVFLAILIIVGIIGFSSYEIIPEDVLQSVIRNITRGNDQNSSDSDKLRNIMKKEDARGSKNDSQDLKEMLRTGSYEIKLSDTEIINDDMESPFKELFIEGISEQEYISKHKGSDAHTVPRGEGREEAPAIESDVQTAKNTIHIPCETKDDCSGLECIYGKCQVVSSPQKRSFTHGYLPYNLEELPQKTYNKTPFQFPKSVTDYEDETTLAVVVISVSAMALLIFILAIIFIFIKLLRPENDVKTHSDGNGARPKDYNNSDRDSSLRRLSSRPPSYRTIAPPGYQETQYEEHGLPSAPSELSSFNEKVAEDLRSDYDRNVDHNVLEGKGTFSTRIHDPIYEEVYEEDPFSSFEDGCEEEAAVPTYENVSPHAEEAPDENPFMCPDSKPEEVRQKLLENQVHIDDLMNQLTRKIIKQRSREDTKPLLETPSNSTDN